ncbi:hypothetical protein HS088_TW03G00660 [Tripterygium wilfordii]|uniref:Uncharacterized protein n=1 Tax=Tripterygium wilfordii TaxID=458696 RepID=A0A7J7DVZ1_TRIWF|nr:hypothetical protein HS088_TW03G00660 [Tripterygium wilfordii]
MNDSRPFLLRCFGYKSGYKDDEFDIKGLVAEGLFLAGAIGLYPLPKTFLQEVEVNKMDFLRRLKEIINLPCDDVMSSPQWFSQKVLPHETLRLDSSHLEVEVNKMEITNLPPDDAMSSPLWFSQNVLPHENLRLDSSDMVVEVDKTNLLRRLEEITNLPRDDIMSSLQWFSQNVPPLENRWWVTLNRIPRILMFLAGPFFSLMLMAGHYLMMDFSGVIQIFIYTNVMLIHVLP